MDDLRLTELSVAELVARMATDDPVPGGGSAAALTGAMGAALIQMVVELTRGRIDAEGHEAALDEIRAATASLQSELLRLADVDATAYAGVVKARRMPKETELERESRRVQVDAAVREATRAPLTTARRASMLVDQALRLVPIGNRNAISDVGVAGELAAASVRSALLNVEINLPAVRNDDDLRSEATAELGTLRAELPDREQRLRDAVAERLE